MNKFYIALSVIFLFSCNSRNGKEQNNNHTVYSESEILKELDLSSKDEPGIFFSQKRNKEIIYNFLLDLEHGYFETAGSFIHLYADSINWAIVFEKSGYSNRGGNAEIELTYIGNCINYIIEEYNNRTYISNSKFITLISHDEFGRVRNKNGSDTDDFEIVSPDAKSIIINGYSQGVEHNPFNYESLGITLNNAGKLIDYGSLVRYIFETNETITRAKESDIMKNLPSNIPKLMEVDKFYYISRHDGVLPSEQELYQQIARILVTKDKSQWRPTNKPNNHWSNWESGHL